MKKFSKGWANLVSLLFIASLCLTVVAPAIADDGLLPAPTGVSASDGSYSDRIRVIWGKVPEATSYLVYRATSEGGAKTLVYTTNTPPFNDRIVTPGVAMGLALRSIGDK